MPLVVLSRQGRLATPQQYLAHAGYTDQRTVRRWATHLAQQLERVVHGLKALVIQTNASKRQRERAFRRDLGSQVGRSEHCRSDKSKDFDCLARPIRMECA